MNKKVMVAMSGGVDSSVAAVMLKEQGFDVCGATLKLFDNDDIGEDKKTKTCCSLSDVEDARSVAYRLGFEHFVFNYGDYFKKDVIEKFAQMYERGETPNPCIDCNRYIKFDKMLERALLLEKDYIATGHYARVEYDQRSGRYLLKKAKDESKDQTYMLYAMTQKQLAHTLFPLGGLLKSEVRAYADAHGLVNARKPDSQDICFVKDGDYAGFLQNVMAVESPTGNFVLKDGTVLGEHKGIIHYTVGQRKGLGLSFAQPMYVTDKDKQTNTVTLGEKQELFSKALIAQDVNWIWIDTLDGPMKVTTKTRYRQKETPATIFPHEQGVLVEFDEPQRAITPGQAVVFYDEEVVVGGATIMKAL